MTLPAQHDAASAWRLIAADLRRAIGDTSFDIWLAPVRPQSWDGTMLTLTAPADTAHWLSARFGPVIDRCTHDVLGPAARATFAAGPGAGSGPGTGRLNDERALDLPAPLHPRYSFDQFIIGEGNRLAHAAALAVAELPGQAYNPLFLSAPPGLGKTHLLHAIGNYVSAFGGGATVRYTTTEAFTNHFITALGTRSLESFKRAYRDADVLLIDDIQFLASKAKTEEEFFHTFNALYETGRQLVLTCDRLPRALVSIEQRLRERFEAGLVADIAPPDRATRLAILRKRAALDQIPLADPAVLELIAERVTDNIRTLEGALIRVVAFHSLTQRPVDVPLATEVLDTMYPPQRPRPGQSDQTPRAGRSPTIGEVQAVVAAHFELTVEQLTSSSRAGRINWARQLAIHLARDMTHASLPAIGRAFGGRNHSTVLHACRRVSERLRSDQQAVEELAELTTLLCAQRADRDC